MSEDAILAAIAALGHELDTRLGEVMARLERLRDALDYEASGDLEMRLLRLHQRILQIEIRLDRNHIGQERLPRPRDPIQLGKLIGDIATGQIKDEVETGKDAAATELGRKGGAARASRLSPEERSQAARKAAKRRWNSK